MRVPKARRVFVGILLVGALALTVGPAVAQNICPDPSFEQDGVPGVARTGEKAGYLKVGEPNHWAGIRGPLKVEPFARYRATAYVKGKIAKGNFYALYCYEWNCYEWVWSTSVRLQSAGEWTRVESTFISPYDTIEFHPLAYIDCEHSEAWIDDVVVEKIAEPEAVMAEIAAKQQRSDNEIMLLSRYRLGGPRSPARVSGLPVMDTDLFSPGDIAKARALLGEGSPRCRADTACLLAHTKDLVVRRPFVVAMVQNGGPAMHWGTRRFDEVMEGFGPEERLAICEEAVRADPRGVLAGRGYRMLAEGRLRSGDAIGTCAESRDHLGGIRASVNRLLDAVGGDSPAGKEVAVVAQSIDAASRALDQREASLGNVTVLIGGQAVRPETHAIVTPDEPTAQEEHAARDLRRHLELVTGQAFPLVREAELGERTPLAVGKCRLLKGLGVRVDFEGLGLEGIHIETAGPALVLAGNRRGVLYAAYTFLEDYLGCRWFTPDCSYWPQKGTIAVPAISRRYVPPLEYRATDYPNSRDADWAVRNKINGTITRLDEKRGGKISYHHFVHTFNSLVSPDQYFDEHPEYFSMINGQRVKDHTQLCLTNPEVIELGKQRVRRWIEERPEATIISVSQNDWHNYCQCPDCTALAEREGGQAGPLIHFVNAIADDIREDYPHIIIDTLAYQYTRQPPKRVRPVPNVAVRLCSIECCFIHPLETDPFNKTFVDDIVGWNEICDRLHIWDYVINYAHSICPFPNLYVLKPNINFFIDHGVTGIYEEANYYSKGGELAELRTYIMAKTLWDPSYDTDVVIDEFLKGYYGRAAKPIRQYLDLVHESAQSKPEMHVRIYSPPGVGYLTPEVLTRSVGLFDEAEGAVRDDATLLHRVQVARLPLIYSRVALSRGGAYREDGDRLVQEGDADVGALLDRFERICKAEGVTRVREGGPHAAVEAWLEAMPRQPKGLEIERLRSSAFEVSVVPALGGRIWRWRHLPSGRDLLRRDGTEGQWNPSNAGYEEYSQSEYRSPGWGEKYLVKEKAERTLTLEAGLKGDLALTRHLELDAERPVLSITSTLSNTAGAPRKACLRVHPEFLVGSTQRATVAVLRPGDKWERHSLANPEDPKAEKELWLRGGDRPAGAWVVIDEEADLAIINRFDAEAVEQCLLNWSGAQNRVNLELYTPTVELPPGGKLTLKHSYEVICPGGRAVGQ